MASPNAPKEIECVVKSIHPKGFGFASSTQGDIFLTPQVAQIGDLQQGQRVRVVVVPGEKGPAAVEIAHTTSQAWEDWQHGEHPKPLPDMMRPVNVTFKCWKCAAVILRPADIFKTKGGCVWTNGSPASVETYGKPFFNKHKKTNAYQARCKACKMNLGTYYPERYDDECEPDRTFPCFKLMYTMIVHSTSRQVQRLVLDGTLEDVSRNLMGTDISPSRVNAHTYHMVKELRETKKQVQETEAALKAIEQRMEHLTLEAVSAQRQVQVMGKAWEVRDEENDAWVGVAPDISKALTAAFVGNNPGPIKELGGSTFVWAAMMETTCRGDVRPVRLCEKAELRAKTQAVWEYEADAGVWAPYPESISEQIESACQRGGDSPVVVDVLISSEKHPQGSTYEIRIAEGVQVNRKTGFKRKIRRQSLKVIKQMHDFCREPDRMHDGGVREFVLHHGGQSAREVLDVEAAHYNRATTQFLMMIGKEKLKKVTKVHFFSNPELERRFEITKASFDRERKPMEEIFVFHGTPEANIVLIMTQGFRVGGEDVDVANGTVHGKGVYSATGPNTPISYANGSPCVVLALALVGRKGQKHTEPVDSWAPKDDWIIFRKKEQVLPVYAVYFE